MNGTKNCAKCGAPFTMSRTNSTVNCPACRRRPSTATPSAPSATSEDRYNLGKRHALDGTPKLATGNAAYLRGYDDHATDAKPDNAQEDTNTMNAQDRATLARIAASDGRFNWQGRFGSEDAARRKLAAIAKLLGLDVDAAGRYFRDVNHCHRLSISTTATDRARVELEVASAEDAPGYRVDIRAGFGGTWEPHFHGTRDECEDEAADVRDSGARARVVVDGTTEGLSEAARALLAKTAPTTPDNAGERIADGSLIAELAGADYVTTSEAASVIEWCQEWARDTFEDYPEHWTHAAILRRCHLLIDGGLAFVLADVRRVANDARQGIDRACPACAAQNESGPYPDHAAGCPDQPYDAITQAIKTARADGFHVDNASGPRAPECIAAAVTTARVTGSVGATYSIGGESTPESTAKVSRKRQGYCAACMQDDHCGACDCCEPEEIPTIGNVPVNDYSAEGIATMREHLAVLSDGTLDVTREHSGTEDGYLWYVKRNGQRTESGGCLYESDALREAITATRESYKPAPR